LRLSTDQLIYTGAVAGWLVIPPIEPDRAVAQRIRASIAGLETGAGSGITVSVGVACAPDDATTRDDLVAAADVALYRAKALGGDGVAVAEAATAPTLEPAEAPARS
jgi:predicted signal transduction protein with EAL and GGDEF domain